MTRPTWDETWAEIARVIGRRSRCGRARVGCVIVDPTNRIVASGYNGPPAGADVPWNDDCSGTEEGWCPRGRFGPELTDAAGYDDCIALHSEANALSFCDRRDRLGGTIYVVGSPCYTCAKLIANSGLARVVIVPDGDRAYRDPEASELLLRSCGLVVDLL